jgi:hypothetical protein
MAVRNQAGRARGSRRKRVATQAAMAQKGVELEAVRTLGPLATLRYLRRLEAEGHVLLDESAAANKEDFDLINADVAISLEDEDFDAGDSWINPTDKASEVIAVGSQGSNDHGAPYIADSYELNICNGVCAFSPPAWAYECRAITPSGEGQLYELMSKFRVFTTLADWLSTNRSDFLRSCDQWDLGPLTLDELSHGGAAVVQKNLLHMLHLNPKVSEETFSRILDQSSLVWPDGAVPVRQLFSSEAKLAWVARSVMLFAKKFGQRLTEKTLENCQNIQVARKKGARAGSARGDLAGVDFPSFVELTNAMVRTRWQDVLLLYRERMLQL